MCKLVLENAEQFCNITFSEKPSDKSGTTGSTDKKLRGSSALIHQRREIEHIMATDAKSLYMPKLKMLKQLAWMLDGLHQEKVKEWVVSVALRYAATGGQLCITAASETEHGLVLAKSGMSASAASSSSEIVKVMKPIASKKEAKAVDKVSDKKKALMMEFFKKKH